MSNTGPTLGVTLFSLTNEWQKRLYTLESMITKVAELGLRLPAQLVDEVEGDGRRRAGNRIVRHLTDGPPVTLLAG